MIFIHERNFKLTLTALNGSSSGKSIALFNISNRPEMIKFPLTPERSFAPLIVVEKNFL